MRGSTLFFIACLAWLVSSFEFPRREPVDYVNPYAGNISHLLVPTFPTVQLPNSMLRVYPERSDYTSEYLNGLPVIVTNHRERSAFKLSVATEEILRSAQNDRADQNDRLVIPVSYDNEHLTPYSFDVTLADGEIHAKYALSHQSAIYSLEAGKPLRIILASEDGSVYWDGKALRGCQTVEDETRVYVYMEPEVKPVWQESFVKGDSSWVSLAFDKTSVRLRYGVSFIDVDQAKANLRREIADYDVDALAAKGRKIWNETLGRIAVKGSEKRKRVFYTSYYRTFERADPYE